MFRRFVLSVYLALPFPASSIAGKIINVPADQATIQAGIDAANNGDVVLVAPGTYTENINFNGKAITVKSAKGASVATIANSGSGATVAFIKLRGIVWSTICVNTRTDSAAALITH